MAGAIAAGAGNDAVPADAIGVAVWNVLNTYGTIGGDVGFVAAVHTLPANSTRAQLIAAITGTGAGGKFCRSDVSFNIPMLVTFLEVRSLQIKKKIKDFGKFL